MKVREVSIFIFGYLKLFSFAEYLCQIEVYCWTNVSAPPSCSRVGWMSERCEPPGAQRGLALTPALIGTTWLCSSQQWLVPPGCTPPTTWLHWFLSQTSYRAGFVLSRRALTPSSQLEGPAMEWFRCLLQWLYIWEHSAWRLTICTCSFVSEYQSKYPSSSPLPPLLIPSSLSPPPHLGPFSVGGLDRCVWAQCTVCVLFVPMLPVSPGLSPLSVLCAGGGIYWCLSVRTCGTLVTPVICRCK